LERIIFNDTHKVVLFGTRDQPVAETTCQHTKFTRDEHSWRRRDSNQQSQKQAAADPRLRPRCQWDRLRGNCCL